MANEFRHVSVGTELSQTEYEAIGGHLFESQATGDTLYASSATQLSRLGIGSANQILQVSGGVPVWASPTTLPLGSGAVFNWNSGDVLLTHSTDTLTISGTTVSFILSGSSIGTFGRVNPTVPAVVSMGTGVTVSLLDNQSITVTVAGAGVVCIADNRGNSGVFAYEYASATVVELSDPSTAYDVTDVDNARIAVFTAVNSYVLTIKNYTNATRTIGVTCIGGYVNAATAPA